MWLNIMEKYSVLTYIIGDYEIVHEVKEKSPNAEYILVTDNPNIKSDTFDNICQATLERQKVIKAIAPKIDLLLVIGSNYSSNTVSLLRTGTIAGIKQIIRIDTKDDIRNEMFENVKSIAVTASTSTSELLVTDVINYLRAKLDVTVEDFKEANDNWENYSYDGTI